MLETDSKLKIECDAELNIAEGVQTLVVLGRFDCARTIHCQHMIENVLNKIRAEQIDIKFNLYFEAQFEEIRDKLLMQNLGFLEFNLAPLIFIQEKTGEQTIIGSLSEFKTYLNEKYSYQDDLKTEDFIPETKANLKNFLENNGNKYVYFDFEIEPENSEQTVKKVERVIFELFYKQLPRTSENFYKLCTGCMNEKGEYLSYKNSTIHRISAGSFISGGDIKVKGPKSIYGSNFNDENYNILHNSPGILGMVKKGTKNHTNECQFYITLCPLQSFDKLFVAFGRVIQGFQTVKIIADLDTYLQRPKCKVTIKDCGELDIQNDINLC